MLLCKRNILHPLHIHCEELVFFLFVHGVFVFVYTIEKEEVVAGDGQMLHSVCGCAVHVFHVLPFQHLV